MRTDDPAGLVASLSDALLTAKEETPAPVEQAGGVDQIIVQRAGGFNLISPATWNSWSADELSLIHI